MRRFWRVFSRSRRYEDLAVSMEEHIEERTDELVEEGMSREQAAQTARREFGNPTLQAQRSREEWQWRRIEQLLADWKLTLRRLAKAPGFTTTVLLTLAIGIGANTAVFSVINSVVLRPLPYPDADRLVALRLGALRARPAWHELRQRAAALGVDASDVFRAQSDARPRWGSGSQRPPT